MNQTLKFEDAWDRTIAEQDRKYIKQVFETTKNQLENESTPFTTLQQARNHKGELLVTVLIHNVSDEHFSFHKEVLQFVNRQNQQIVAEHTFTIPRLVIEPHTSMPWTFIFPTDKIQENDTTNGTLVFKKSNT